MKVDQGTLDSTSKKTKKQMAETQKIYDIARVQGYDIKNLLESDVTDSNYLLTRMN